MTSLKELRIYGLVVSPIYSNRIRNVTPQISTPKNLANSKGNSPYLREIQVSKYNYNHLKQNKNQWVTSSKFPTFSRITFLLKRHPSAESSSTSSPRKLGEDETYPRENERDHLPHGHFVHGDHRPQKVGLNTGRKYFHQYMGVSKNRGTPKCMVYNGNPMNKLDDLGVPLFLETSTWYLCHLLLP